MKLCPTLLALFACLSHSPLFSQTEDWANAAAGPHDWNTASNWSGGVPDTAGETARFDNPIGGTTVPNTIDISAPITLDRIVWNDNDGDGIGALANASNIASANSVIEYTGAAITMGNDPGTGEGLDLQGAAFFGNPTVVGVSNYRVDFTNNIAFTQDTSINVGQDVTDGDGYRGIIQLEGVLSGSTDLTKTGSGYLDLNGNADNTFSGKFTQSGGQTRLEMTDGTLALSSPEIRLVAGTLNHVGAAGRGSNQLLDTAVLSFANDGSRETWNLNNDTETIANWGGGNGGTEDRLELGAGSKATSVLNFGADNGDSAFAGRIGNDGIINKSGTGTWSLTAANGGDGDGNSPTFDINILDGSFQMNAVHDQNTGTYTIDGDMTGTGVIDDGTVVLNSGATLNAGTQTGASNLTDCSHDINEPATNIVTNQFETLEIKNLTLLSGSTTTFDINSSADIDAGVAALNSPIIGPVAAIGGTQFIQGDGHDEYDQIFSDGGGTLTLSAGGTIIVNPVAFAPVKGMVFDLFSGFGSIVDNGFNLGPTWRSGSQSALFDLKLPDLTTFSSSGTLRWDTSLFLEHGTLVIVPEPSRALLLFLGTLPLALRRRRRR